MKFRSFIRNNVPKPALFLYGFAALSFLIHMLGIFWKGFSDFFNLHIAGFFRMVLAKLTGLYRFSLAEILVLCIPLFAIGVIVAVAVYCKRGQQQKLNRFFAFFLLVGGICGTV